MATYTDNPEIGPLLAKHYWNAGNNVSHNDSIIALTGEGFNAKYLADECNLSAQDAWKVEQDKIAELNSRTQADVAPLHANITIIDGPTTLASNSESNQKMCDDFEAYIKKTYGR